MKFAVISCLFVLASQIISGQVQMNEENNSAIYSEAFQRYKNNDLKFEAVNPFFPRFTYYLTEGLGFMNKAHNNTLVNEKLDIYNNDPQGPYLVRLPKHKRPLAAAYHLRHAIDGFEENTTFRDPTSPIKVGDTYHIWYSKTWGEPPVGQDEGSQESYHEIKDKWKRIYSWDFS